MRKHLKTWIEIKENSVKHNVEVFRNLIGLKVKLAAVVKSNAYGHGLFDFTRVANRHGVNMFCVDSVFEAEVLRKIGIKKLILVLGMTLPENYLTALKNNCTITISNMSALVSWLKSKNRPDIHLKIDTGMHRQGFLINDLPKVIKNLKSQISNLKFVHGIYTHFSSAKDINYPSYTEMQFNKFMKAASLFEKRGFKNLIKHASASSGTMLDSKYHLDMVRIGMGLYGHPPSKELGIQLPNIKLMPVLSWKTIISEIKNVPKGSYISYDLTERVTRNTRVGVLPIGYWHGLPWSLSGVGEVTVKGKSAKILGRVTMDVTMVDITDIPCKPFDIAEIDIMDSSFRAKTSHYEFLTRINPLIQRIIV